MVVSCDDGLVLTGVHHEKLLDGEPLDVPGVEDELAGCRTVAHLGLAVSASRELAFDLRTAIRLYERVPLGDDDVALTLDDPVLLAWLLHRGGAVEVLAP
ncbi:hypothetical protein PSU4_21480 [Pseudonocardia sulfidoxydans NBRC 16205]|uniref:Uncharacterized protein n=2 Tax=Pseudonocardia sulfidoxydans TaxID=54011 RepID=A0A511DHF2_9PSEU|nr:hypothetical protein [Pseudonocardia sulfidoxydans]GEL23194.1 hypothetical protein PSU4_21480 [Pseudonocardia sulfidoxydans NBRC 16205]